jgi:hypothetical protein
MRFIGLVKVTSESVSCLDFAGGVPPLGCSCFVFRARGLSIQLFLIAAIYASKRYRDIVGTPRHRCESAEASFVSSSVIKIGSRCIGRDLLLECPDD